MINNSLFKKSIDAPPLDLTKIGETEYQSDKQIFRYLSGYFKKHYEVVFDEEQLWAIYCVIEDCLGMKK